VPVSLAAVDTADAALVDCGGRCGCLSALSHATAELSAISASHRKKHTSMGVKLLARARGVNGFGGRRSHAQRESRICAASIPPAARIAIAGTPRHALR
jgi:hypothetical protein